jgi:NADH dehydrogenase FAD-containing subunit
MDPVFERKHLDALIAGAFAHGVQIKPAAAAVERWNQLVANLSVDSAQPVQVAVLGAGAQAVELAFAVQQRLQGMGAKHRVLLVLGGCALLANAPSRLRAKVIQRLEDAGIDIQSDRCVGMQAQALYFANGQALTCHMALLVDGCHAPAWLCYSGLALDSNGRVLVNAQLKSVSNANVFASGALAAWQGQTSLAVDSMDAGQTLALNLMAALSQLPLESHAPRHKWHQSIYTTPGQAIGCAGPVVFEHAWLAHQKRTRQLQWVRLNAFNPKAG